MGGIGQPYSCHPHLSVLSHNSGIAPTEAGPHQIFLDASLPCNSRSAMFPCTLWVRIHVYRKKCTCMFLSLFLSAWPVFADIAGTLHIYELFNKTAFTLVLKILILAAMHWPLLLWTKLSIGKAYCAFFLLAITLYAIICLQPLQCMTDQERPPPSEWHHRSLWFCQGGFLLAAVFSLSIWLLISWNLCGRCGGFMVSVPMSPDQVV